MLDWNQARAMANHWALMIRGLLQQVAKPADHYEYPYNRFVTDFIGSVNLLKGWLAIDEPDHGIVDARDWVGIRPERIAMTPLANGPPPSAAGVPDGYDRIQGAVRTASYLGGETVYDVEQATGTIVTVLSSNVRRLTRHAFGTGDAVWLGWNPRSPLVLLS